MMIKKYLSLAPVLAIFSLALPHSAEAGPKFGGLWWWESHWKNQDFIPYYDNGTDPHNSQWSDSTWTPADWIKASGGNGESLVQTWLANGIIAGSYKDSDGIPYLDVGPNFYHLSGYDKRRVTETLDAIYQITAKKPSMYYLKDPATKQVIGTYTKQGLTLE